MGRARRNVFDRRFHLPWYDAAVTVAALPVVASLGTLALSQRHARRTAQEDQSHNAVRDRQTRLFQAREARYADRLAAAVDFIAAANDETDAVVQFERDPRHDGLSRSISTTDYEFSKFNASYARLAILASPAVTAAAGELRQAVYDCFMGKENRWETYNATVEQYQDRAREMLAEDNEVDLSTAHRASGTESPVA